MGFNFIHESVTPSYATQHRIKQNKYISHLFMLVWTYYLDESIIFPWR